MSYALALRHGLGDLLPQRGPVEATAMTPGRGPAPVVAKDKPKVRLPVVQGQAPKFSLQSLIEQYLMMMDETQRIAVAFKYGGERSRGVFHASEVSKESACLRALAYDIYKAPLNDQAFIEVPNGITAPQMKRIFHNGHFTHARLESYIIAAVEQNKGKAWNELSYEPDGKLRSGTADVGLILYGWPYLVEIKSIKKGDKNNPDGGGFIFLGAEPDPDHKAQLNQYMGLAGVGAGFILYECVPDSARALTRRGWKHHWEIDATDELLTYSTERNVMEWEPYQRKVVNPWDGELLRVGNKHTEFFCTPNHRWAVRDQSGRMQVRLAKDLNSNCWIPYHAPYVLDGGSILTEYEAEALGWVVSDGWVSGSQLYISQSKPDGIAAIRSLLRKGDYTEAEYTKPPGGWNPDGQRLTYFALKGHLREMLLSSYRKKADLLSIVGRLDHAALEGLYRGMLGGDGSWSSSGRNEQFCQRDGVVKEAFQIVCTLLGRRLNINEGKLSCYPGTHESLRSYTPTSVPYKGDVWCPVTRNTTWVMEQNGKAIITGNCKDNQALREYFVQFDRALWDKIERERVDVVLDHVKRGTLPDKISDEDGCSGTWCKFYTICKKRGGQKWLPGG